MPSINPSSSFFEWGEAVIDPETKKPRLSPKILGLDIEKAKETIADAKKAEIKPKQDLVDSNTKRLASLKEYKDLTYAFKESSLKLSHYVGVNASIPNVFNQKIADGHVSDGTSIIQNVSITPTTKALSSQFTLEITQLATSDIVKMADYTDETTQIGQNGNLVINGVTFTVTSTMTRKQLFDAIAAQKTTTKVDIDVMMTTPGTYTHLLKAQELAKSIDFTGTDSSIRTALGLPSSNTDVSTLKAKGKYNGISFERTLNKVTDLVPEATVEFYRASTAKINAFIDDDKGAVIKSIQEWVDNYNKLEDFVEKHSQLKADKSGPTEEALLYRNKALNLVDYAIKSTLVSRTKLYTKTDTVQGSNSVAFSNENTAANITGNLKIHGTTISLTSTMTWTDIKTAVNNQTSTTKVSMDFITPITNKVTRLLGQTEGRPIDLNGTDSSVLTALGYSSDTANSSKLTERQSALDDFRMFFEMGITVESREAGGYKLKLDTTKMTDKVINNFDLVKKLFGISATSSSTNFDVWAIPKDLKTELANKDITISYQKNADGTYQASLSANSKTLPALVKSGLITALSDRIKGNDSEAFNDENAAANISGDLSIAYKTLQDNKVTINYQTIALYSTDTWKQTRDKINTFASTTGVYAEITTSASGKVLQLLTSSGTIDLSGTSQTLLDAFGFSNDPSASERLDANYFDGFKIGFRGTDPTAGSSAITGTFKVTQGLADKTQQKLTDMMSEQTGVFKLENDAILQKNDSLKKEITKLEAEMKTELNRLSDSFQKVYESVLQYESILTTLNSYRDALKTGSI
ncbi:MAG: flagellar filament capping protein FliD [Proteobacteria bacterium]|nr:flagellar filament capping protein FliD [Pseudomonadota bacterium]